MTFSNPDSSNNRNGADMVRVGVVIVLVAMLTGVAFIGGFLSGGLILGRSGTASGNSQHTNVIPTRTPLPGSTAVLTPTNSTVTFQLFWDVWSLLQQDYYGDLPDEQHMTYGAIRGVLGTLDDKFTSFIEPDVANVLREDSTGSFEGIGAVVRMNADNQLQVVRPYPGQPAAKAGVLAGDIVTFVDDTPVTGMGIYEAIGLIRGPAGTSVTLTILRAGNEEPIKYTIVRASIEIPLVIAEMRPDGVAYIALTQFDNTATDQLETELKKLLEQNPKGVILDLRDNPGGFLREAISLSDLFLDKGLVMIERKKDGSQETYNSADGGIAEGIPLVVLINGGSASASEIVAGALQDRGRAKLIGEQSFGKGSVQLPHDLSDGSQLRITIARWYTPNDHGIHGVGLTPDIEIPITPDDAKAGRDPQLERAAEYILTGK